LLLPNVDFDLVAARSQTESSQVTKPNGEVVEGKIKGIVVNRAKVANADGLYSVIYYFNEGKYITRITERGTTIVKGGSMLRIITDRGVSPADESAVPGLALRMYKGSSRAGSETLPNKVHMIAFFSDEETLTTEFPVVGELRMEQEQAVIIPAIEILTSKGLVRLPASEIVKIKTKPRS
jgi:hypothetical protein